MTSGQFNDETKIERQPYVAPALEDLGGLDERTQSGADSNAAGDVGSS